jgi:hypothetical protein
MAFQWLTLQDHDLRRVGAQLHRPADRRRRDAVAVAVEVDEAGLGNRRRRLVKALERPLERDQGRFLLLEHLPDGPVLELWMPGGFGVGDDARLQHGVQFVIVGGVDARFEKPVSRRLHLVLDLAARHCRSDQWRNKSAPHPAAGEQAVGSTR